MKIRTLIIDDEPLAREGMVNYVKQVAFLELVKPCEHPLEALDVLSEGKVDLILLDIQMPHITGLDFLKGLSRPPLTIFTTAYPSYALEGYQLDVLDYLVKPITFERFMKAAHKALRQMQLMQASQAVLPKVEADHFFVKCENQYEKIRYDEILFIEALQNYVSIYTTKQKYITLLSMKAVEEALPSEQFMRVHRSYMIAADKIQTFKGHEVLIGEYRVPVSRAQREAVLQRVIKDKLLGS